MSAVAETFLASYGKAIIGWLIAALVAVLAWLAINQFAGMGNLSERVALLDRKIDLLQASLDGAGKVNDLRLAQIQGNMDGVSRRIDGIEADRAKVRDDLYRRVDALEKQSYVPPTRVQR